MLDDSNWSKGPEGDLDESLGELTLGDMDFLQRGQKDHFLEDRSRAIAKVQGFDREFVESGEIEGAVEIEFEMADGNKAKEAFR